MMLRRANSYQDRAPDSPIGLWRRVAYDLLREHHRDGMLPTTIRFLYYELVQRSGMPPCRKNRAPINDLTQAITDLRKQGDIPWTWIIDESRQVESFAGASDLKSWTKDVLEQARLDPWDGNIPMVITESRAVAGVLRATCERYAVRLAAVGGHCAGFLHNDIPPMLDSTVLYFGDHNIAGGSIEDNTRDVLEQSVGPLAWERLAVTLEQVRKYRLPPKPKDDKRFGEDRGLHDSYECEALSQKRIIEILERRLDDLLPEPLEAVLEREAQQRAAMLKLISKVE
jgi:hypothetical protein